MQHARKAKGKALYVTGVPPKGRAAVAPADTPGARRPPRSAVPERQCVVCRTVGPTWTLLQLAAAAGPGRKVGRSAYVCIALACLQGLGARGWARALPGAHERLSAADLVAALQSMAAVRVTSLLGLARRQGVVILGAGRLSETPPERLAATLLAADVAPRTVRQLERDGHTVMSLPFLASQPLGAAVGAAPLAALGIRPGRLATQAAYWLRVWYEAHSRDVSGVTNTLSQAARAEAPTQQPAKQVDDRTATDETRTGRRIEVAR